MTDGSRPSSALNPWALCLAGPLILAATGCHKKVDCNKFCDREAECITAISVQLGVATEQRIQTFTDAEVKLLGDKQRERCMKSCNDEAKPKEIDTKWNACLEKSDCAEFAACVYAEK